MTDEYPCDTCEHDGTGSERCARRAGHGRGWFGCHESREGVGSRR